MPRPTNKTELLAAANTNFTKLWQHIDAMSAEALNTPFDFSDVPNKKEAHWARDKNVRDVLVHLYEWHQLLIQWIRSNTSGTPADFLPAPYTWKTYGEMNVEFWHKHQQTALTDAAAMLKQSHEEVIKLLEPFSNDALFSKQHFDWTGTTSLGSYCISALSSHYDWALKKLRLHMKKFG